MAGRARELKWCQSRTAEMTTLLSATIIVFVVNETATLSVLIDHALNHLVGDRRHRFHRDGDAHQPFPHDLDLDRLRFDLHPAVANSNAQLHPRLELSVFTDLLGKHDPPR